MRIWSVSVFAFLLLFPSVAPSADEWSRIVTPNFELYTTCNQRMGREAILHFEKIRAFFLARLKVSDISAGRVRIVAFSGEKNFRPYSINDFASAYYAGGPRRHWIVMKDLTHEYYPVAVHEYTHLVIRAADWKIPVWLHEGLAELYSTLASEGSKMRVGDILTGHHLRLRREKWLDLETLFSAGQESAHYNERVRAGLFYAQSWALTHMLTLSGAYAPNLTRFLRLLGEEKSSADALQDVYGKTPAQVKKDLENYMGRTRFMAGVVDVQLENAAAVPEARPAAPVESGLVLAELLGTIRRTAEARTAFDALAKENPEDVAIAEARARFELAHGQPSGARAHFERAGALGSRDARLYYDHALLLMRMGEPPAAAVPLLEKAVDIQPDFRDAHHRLGFLLVEERRYADAVRHLSAFRQVTREEAFPYFHTLAFACYESGDITQARQAAARAREYARTPEEIANVERLDRYVNREPARAASPAAAPARAPAAAPAAPTVSTPASPPASSPAKKDEAAPRLKRRPAPMSTFTEERSAPAPAMLTAEGVFVRLDCLAGPARLILSIRGKETAFAIRNPKSVLIEDDTGAAMEFTCGRQKARRMILEYRPSPDGKLGTLGDAAAIRFPE